MATGAPPQADGPEVTLRVDVLGKASRQAEQNHCPRVQEADDVFLTIGYGT